MDVSTFPTKSNLLSAKSNLHLSQTGYELLDRKRNILIGEMFSHIKRAEKIQSQINEVFSEAYKALQLANIRTGISTVQQIGYAMKDEDSIQVRYKSIMGAEIPIVTSSKNDLEVTYSFFRTNYSLDLAYERFNKVKELIIEMAEVENTVYRLADHIKKTQKRANALKTIMIPRYENLIDFIEKYIEEKDREDLTRLHLIKMNQQ